MDVAELLKSLMKGDKDTPAEEVAEDEVAEVAGDEISENLEETDDSTDTEDEADESIEAIDEAESAELAELRETILSQAAEIETLKNRVAELGGDLSDDDYEEEVEAHDEHEDHVAAFDSDYEKRKALLTELTEGHK